MEDVTSAIRLGLPVGSSPHIKISKLEKKMFWHTEREKSKWRKNYWTQQSTHYYWVSALQKDIWKEKKELLKNAW